DVRRENEVVFSQGRILSQFEGLRITRYLSYRSYSANRKRVHSEIQLSNSNERGFSLTSPLVTTDITGSDWIDFSTNLNRYVVTNIYAEYTVENSGNHYIKGLVGVNQEYENYHD